MNLAGSGADRTIQRQGAPPQILAIGTRVFGTHLSAEISRPLAMFPTGRGSLPSSRLGPPHRFFTLTSCACIVVMLGLATAKDE